MKFEFRYGATKISYGIYERNKKCKEDELRGLPFIVGDVLGYLPEFDKAVYIYDIETQFGFRNQGHAKAALNDFIRKIADTMPIVSVAGASHYNFPIEPTEEQIDQEIEWQGRFLTSIGFTCINQYVQYEDSEAYLLVTDKTQPYIDGCEAAIKELEADKAKHGLTVIETEN